MTVARQIDPSDSAETTACRCREQALSPERTAAKAELSELARELARSLGEKVEEYGKYCNLSPQEARQRVDQNSPECIDRILNAPPDEVNWFDLYALAEKDAALALERWENIKQTARSEIESGFRAARTIEDAGGPLERARFGAVRAKLMEDWRPCNGTQQLLVDQLAQWQVLLWRWQEAMTAWINCAISDIRGGKKGKSYEMMRLSEAEALERATEKVERIHRMYLRTLKALQDQRRLRSPIAVRHAEQVNVGPVQISVADLDLSPNGNEGSS
jgi:hypothetical protein